MPLFVHLKVTGLTLLLVDTETFTVLSTSTFGLHDPHLADRESGKNSLFGILPLAAGLTLQLVGTEASYHYYFYSLLILICAWEDATTTFLNHHLRHRSYTTAG